MIVIVINVEDQYVNRIQQQILAIKDSELGIHEVVWGDFIFVRFALRTSLTLNLKKKSPVLKKSMEEQTFRHPCMRGQTSLEKFITR
jgi:hypothetical protein